MKTLLRLNFVVTLLVILFCNAVQSQHTHIEYSGEALRIDGDASWISFWNGNDYKGYLFSDASNMWLRNIKDGFINFKTSSSQGMRLQSSGNLSLGTTDDNARFDVHGASDETLPVINAMVNYEGNSDIVSVIGTSTPSNSWYGIGGSFTGGYRGVIGSIPSSITTGSSSSAVLGINSSATGTKHGIYGSSSIEDSSWAGYFAGNIYYSGTFTSTSDERLKKNINGLENALDKIVGLSPVSYEYKTEEFNKINLAKGSQIGFTAQDMEKVFPQLVSEDIHIVENNKTAGAEKSEETMTIKSVNYIGMIPVLTKGIQEQQLLIETLIDKIEQLETEVNTLKHK